MGVSRPNIKELQQAALELGLHQSEDDARSFHKLMQAQLDAYDLVDAMVAPLPEVKYPRTPAFRPQADVFRCGCRKGANWCMRRTGRR